MTRKEFEKYRMQVESDNLRHTDNDLLSFGMQRAMFEKGKLTKLIAAAGTVEGKTARTYAERWKRKLKKISLSQNNFQKLREDLRNTKLDFFRLFDPAKGQAIRNLSRLALL